MTYKLPEGWKEVKLGEVIEVHNRKRIPLSSKERSKLEKNYPYYGAQGIIDYVDDYIFDGMYLLVAEDGENLRSRKQNIGIIANGKFWVNNHAHILSESNSSDLRYLFYNINLLDIEAYLTGSVQPKLNRGNLEKIKLNLPPLPEQKAIADTLSVIDDKIELNNKINENLEAQAQAIFKHWFVDFEFPDKNGNPYKSSGGEMVESELGMIPKGWEVENLGSKLKVELGGTPARKNSDYWGGDINWINSGELNSYRIIKETERITELGLEKSSTKLWPKNTTVIEITGSTLGKTSLLLIDTCANQSVVGIKENEEIPFTYVYPYIVSRVLELAGHQTGGAQQHINKGNVEELDLILPKAEIIKKYNNVIKQHYKYIETNEFENIQLSQLRDTLLPKLMSGEIRIPLD